MVLKPILVENEVPKFTHYFLNFIKTFTEVTYHIFSINLYMYVFIYIYIYIYILYIYIYIYIYIYVYIYIYLYIYIYIYIYIYVIYIYIYISVFRQLSHILDKPSIAVSPIFYQNYTNWYTRYIISIVTLTFWKTWYNDSKRVIFY